MNAGQCLIDADVAKPLEIDSVDLLPNDAADVITRALAAVETGKAVLHDVAYIMKYAA